MSDLDAEWEAMSAAEREAWLEQITPLMDALLALPRTVVRKLGPNVRCEFGEPPEGERPRE